MSEDEAKFKPEELVHSCGTAPGRYCLRCGLEPYVERKTEGTVTGRTYIPDPEPQSLYPRKINLKHYPQRYVIGIDYSALEEAILAAYSLDDVYITQAFYDAFSEPCTERYGLPGDDERSDEVS